jgi:hypothetical protein
MPFARRVLEEPKGPNQIQVNRALPSLIVYSGWALSGVVLGQNPDKNFGQDSEARRQLRVNSIMPGSAMLARRGHFVDTSFCVGRGLLMYLHFGGPADIVTK